MYCLRLNSQQLWEILRVSTVYNTVYMLRNVARCHLFKPLTVWVNILFRVQSLLTIPISISEFLCKSVYMKTKYRADAYCNRYFTEIVILFNCFVHTSSRFNAIPVLYVQNNTYQFQEFYIYNKHMKYYRESVETHSKWNSDQGVKIK